METLLAHIRSLICRLPGQLRSFMNLINSKHYSSKIILIASRRQALVVTGPVLIDVLDVVGLSQ